MREGTADEEGLLASARNVFIDADRREERRLTIARSNQDARASSLSAGDRWGIRDPLILPADSRRLV